MSEIILPEKHLITKPKWYELYRAFVPRNRILNDNSGQHYRTMQGKLNFLEAQFEAFKNGDPTYGSIVGGFKYEDIGDMREIIGDKPIEIRCEVWRANNVIFDPHNYSKTFKMPIDKLTKYEKMALDDNWKFVEGTKYAGGGSRAWRRSYLYRNVDYNDEVAEQKDGYSLMADGLPKDMTIEWWNEYSEDLGDIFIRVLVMPVEVPCYY